MFVLFSQQSAPTAVLCAHWRLYECLQSYYRSSRARMRALQMGPVHDHPQIAIVSMIFDLALGTELLLYMHLCSDCSNLGLHFHPLGVAGRRPGMQDYTRDGVQCGELGARSSSRCLAAHHHGVCLCRPFHATPLRFFTIEHPKGADYTPPIFVTMQCVINLTFQFLSIFIMFGFSSVSMSSPAICFPC